MAWFLESVTPMIEFFMPMRPPTVTAQEHKISTRNGKVRVYQPPQLADARAKLEAHLGQYAPKEPLDGALILQTKWCFPKGKHPDGSYKTTRPDTDNLNKLLKDCMTRLRFWKDDAQVAVEINEKRWCQIPGIYIRIEELP